MNYGGAVEGLLKGTGASFLTNWFIAVLLCLFVLALGMLFLGKWRRLTANAPGLLTSIGILGTFAGIITGLLDFNPNELDKSIGPLLEGLKTAFTSSLVGMALSILFKFISTFPIVQKQSEQSVGSTTMHDLYVAIERQTGVLKSQADEVTVQSSNINKLFNAVFSTNDLSINSQITGLRNDSQQFQTKATGLLANQIDSTRELISKISNDGESSLTGQLKLLRMDLTDGQKDLVGAMQQQAAQNTEIRDSSVRLESKLTEIGDVDNAFQGKLLRDTEQLNKSALEQREEFSEFDLKLEKQLDKVNESLATSPTEHVIEALKEVTREFNNIIVEQFGDNFKHLNDAVGQLLIWQENYRDQLAQMDRQYNESIKAIQQSELSVGNISESTKVIPEHMSALGAVIKTNQAQVDDINQHLVAFAQLRDKAVEAIPQTQKTIDNLLSELEQGNKKLIEGVEQTTGRMTDAIAQSTDRFANSANESNSKLAETSETLAKTGKTLEDSGSKVLADFGVFGEVLIEQATKARKEVEKGLEESHENLIEEIRKSANLHADKASSIHSGLQKTIEESLAQTNESISSSIEAQFKSISDLRNDELRRTMDQLGKALTTMTGKFTEDYKTLVDAMAKVVNQRPRT